LFERVRTRSPTLMVVPSAFVSPSGATSPSVTRSLWARVFRTSTVWESAAIRIAGTPFSVSVCQAV